MFIQALVINLTPLLFIPLKEEFGLTYEQVGRLVLINFCTQMVTDLVCCWLADRVSVKPLAVLANVLAAVGLWVFAWWPGLCANPYAGLVLGTVVFSVGCGLLEVLLSPIINAIPSSHKPSQMALLHAFYPIGKVGVIAVTALALYAWGAGGWRWILVSWSVFPLVNSVGFLWVTLPTFVPEGTRHRLRELARLPQFWVLAGLMLMAGATEVTLAQWLSAFAEKGLACPKLLADLAGFGLFGVGMILGRLWFGVRGHSLDLTRAMGWGALASAGFYVVISLSPWPALALAACGPAGFVVSMLWPGTLSLGTERFPLAGASMFALLAAAGDTGAAVMPWLVGFVADHAVNRLPGIDSESAALRLGLLSGLVCPLLFCWALGWAKRQANTR
jgi:fucose permease